MLNIEKYQDDIKRLATPYFSVVNGKIGECDEDKCKECIIHKETHDCVYNRLDWLVQEYKEPILTDKEKEYLKNVIEPRKDEVVYIKKTGVYAGREADCCCVSIYIKSQFYGKKSLFVDANAPWVLLDFLTIEDMPFEGMVIDKRYTLEELGL